MAASSSTRPFQWLRNLKIPELHKVAVSIGAPCSGTKASLSDGIARLLIPPTGDNTGPSGRGAHDKLLSLVSIDMGIRNLAYAHFSATTTMQGRRDARYRRYQQPRLETWQRLTVSVTRPTTKTTKTKALSSGENKKAIDIASDVTAAPDIEGTTTSRADRESYDPSTYAAYAVDFIKTIIDRHNPTHILIERQRFRSGGGSAVQEWTIRVGIFEAMLYAVLRTLAVEKSQQIRVEGIQAAGVNRYWLEPLPGAEDEDEDSSAPAVKKPFTGKAAKAAKIALVARAIDNDPKKPLESRLGFEVSDAAVAVTEAFVAKFKKKPSASKSGREGKSCGQVGTPAVEAVAKLDDLADCLLQGMAWINWQNRREELRVFRG